MTQNVQSLNIDYWESRITQRDGRISHFRTKSSTGCPAADKTAQNQNKNRNRNRYRNRNQTKFVHQMSICWQIWQNQNMNQKPTNRNQKSDQICPPDIQPLTNQTRERGVQSQAHHDIAGVSLTNINSITCIRKACIVGTHSHHRTGLGEPFDLHEIKESKKTCRISLWCKIKLCSFQSKDEDRRRTEFFILK